MATTFQLKAPDRTAGSRTFTLAVAILGLALVGSVVVAASFGAVSLPIDTLATAFTTPREEWTPDQVILVQVRIPRVLTAALVGAGLAAAGVALQTTLRNPLAEPYLLGISSGASLGAVSVILLGVGVFLPLAALTGGVVALLATLLLSGAHKKMPAERVILGGVAITALFSALTSLVIFQSPDNDSYQQVLHWLLGSLASSNWSTVVIAGVSILILGVILLSVSRLLGLFLLSDNEVTSLGINIRQARAGVLTVAALLAASMVSVSGAIGFVGLIVPHLAKPISRGSVLRHLINSLLVGALLLVWADTFSRLVALPEELPVGITTSLLGALVFAVIMLRQRERN